MEKIKKSKVKTVQAVDRTLSILIALGKAGKAESLSKISHQVSLNISTTHRLLSTLIVWGFVEQDKETGKYKLGLKAFEIGNSALKELDICKVSKPLMKQVVDKFNETVNIAVLDANDVVYIEQVESQNVIKMMASPGTRGPAYCTGSGKVLLSQFSNNELSRRFNDYKFEQYTLNTVSDLASLLQSISEVRERGYALDLEEMEYGVKCAAVPIKNKEGEIIAALSLSGPSNRLSNEYLKDSIVPILLLVAKQIERNLGFSTLD